MSAGQAQVDTEDRMDPSRSSSALRRRTVPRAAAPGIGACLLALLMACNLGQSLGPNIQAPQGGGEAQPTGIVTPLGSAQTGREAEPGLVPTVTAIPTVQTGQVVPLSGFDEILVFGGGGGGFFPCLDFHTSKPGDIQIDLPVGVGEDVAILCVSLGGVQTAAPVRITIQHTGSSGIVLESGKLILDLGRHSVYWPGFAEQGSIVAWTLMGTVRFGLSLWWPATLPDGDWTIAVAQEGGPRADGEFLYSRPEGIEGVSYIQALHQGSEQELLPHNAEAWSRYMMVTNREDLKVSGGRYPPNQPVYILLYEKPDFKSEYFLIHEAVWISDSQGSIYGEIETRLRAGREYLLYGITDPDIDLTEAHISCRQSAGHACDVFLVASPAIAGVPYSTQVPLSCPGAPPQYIVPDQPAYVCTRAEAVHLREGPSHSAEILRQLEPGTIFQAGPSGPSCADNRSWWLVYLEDGTSGWVAEGGDETDPYFICPLP